CQVFLELLDQRLLLLFQTLELSPISLEVGLFLQRLETLLRFLGLQNGAIDIEHRHLALGQRKPGNQQYTDKCNSLDAFQHNLSPLEFELKAASQRELEELRFIVLSIVQRLGDAERQRTEATDPSHSETHRIAQ